MRSDCSFLASPPPRRWWCELALDRVECVCSLQRSRHCCFAKYASSFGIPFPPLPASAPGSPARQLLSKKEPLQMAERMEPNVVGSLGPSGRLARSPRAQASGCRRGTGMKEARGSRQALEGCHATGLRRPSRKPPCVVTER